MTYLLGNFPFLWTLTNFNFPFLVYRYKIKSLKKIKDGMFRDLLWALTVLLIE